MPQITPEAMADLARHTAKRMHDQMNQTVDLVSAELYPSAMALMILDTLALVIGEGGAAALLLSGDATTSRDRNIDATNLAALALISRPNNASDWEAALRDAVVYFRMIFHREPLINFEPFYQIMGQYRENKGR